MRTITVCSFSDPVHDRMELTVGRESFKLVKPLQIICRICLCSDSKGYYGSCSPAIANCKTVSMPLMGMTEIDLESAKAPVRYEAVKSVGRHTANAAATSLEVNSTAGHLRNTYYGGG